MPVPGIRGRGAQQRRRPHPDGPHRTGGGLQAAAAAGCARKGRKRARVSLAAAAATVPRYHSRGPLTTSLQLVRVVRTGKMAGPRVTRCLVVYCVAFAAAAIASRADGVVYEKIPLGE